MTAFARIRGSRSESMVPVFGLAVPVEVEEQAFVGNRRSLPAEADRRAGDPAADRPLENHRRTGRPVLFASRQRRWCCKVPEQLLTLTGCWC